MEHTPKLPLEYFDYPKTNDVILRDSEYKMLGRIEDKQVAAYIVKCCNLYPEMVAGIKSAMSLLATLKDNPLSLGAKSEYYTERAMLERKLSTILQKIGEE